MTWYICASAQISSDYLPLYPPDTATDSKPKCDRSINPLTLSNTTKSDKLPREKISQSINQFKYEKSVLFTTKRQHNRYANLLELPPSMLC